MKNNYLSLFKLMGCGGSKVIEEPIKIIYHPMNQHLDANLCECPHLVYDILEYWF